ncbi:MAG: iron-sulfur protein, partial [Clostridia bacterium]|nr:iron-sulfur protein [Clostridia bacterium]
MERIVSLRKCDNYEYKEVENAVNNMFEDLGGIEKFAKSGDKVLLKFNLLNNLKVELCATTHPVLVEIVAKKFIELGCEVIIG